MEGKLSTIIDVNLFWLNKKHEEKYLAETRLLRRITAPIINQSLISQLQKDNQSQSQFSPGDPFYINLSLSQNPACASSALQSYSSTKARKSEQEHEIVLELT